MTQLLKTATAWIGQRIVRGAFRGLVRSQIDRADGARDRRQYRDAAVLYGEALRLDPDNGPILVQCGHMLKEAGDLAAAEQRYGAAMRLMPGDADLALQMGHLLKLAGQPERAEQAYRTASRLAPTWDEPQAELRALRAQAAPASTSGEMAPNGPLANDLAPELLPSLAPAAARQPRRGVHITGLGRMERTGWGTQWTLRGVTALRGFVISAADLQEVVVRLGDTIVAREPLAGMATEGLAEQRKYAFNIWIDVSAVVLGSSAMDFEFRQAGGPAQTHRATVVVAPALDEAAFPDSDGLVTSPKPAMGGPALEAWINARPSMVRHARRQWFTAPPRTILIQRIDQLGDLVCSVPAIRRLREIFPRARLIGLVSPANRELADTLDLFDDTLTADLPDDPREQRRTMPLAEQVALRERLAAFDIDLAIDLSTSGVSRPLLRLSGAEQTYGFREEVFGWMSADFLAVTRDPVDGLEAVPHSRRVLGLVEWLNVLASEVAPTEPRGDLSPGVLAPLGLTRAERFVVLHTGARITFSRWPFYGALAALILARTDLSVVMLGEDRVDRAALPPDVLTSARFKLLDRRLPFDQLDGLVSFCAAFVGNDSGPKHLAGLRGAKVVSLHAARINWNEWGQEHGGVIISRRVPCAGCAIHHHAEECGKGFACITHIDPEEVFDAVIAVLDAPDAVRAAKAAPNLP